MPDDIQQAVPDEGNTKMFTKQIQLAMIDAIDSKIFGVSIRSWLAILVIGTICAQNVALTVRAIRVADYNYTVDNQFMQIALMVVMFFFQKNGTSVQPPPQNK